MLTRIHTCVLVRSRTEPLNLCSNELLGVGWPSLCPLPRRTIPRAGQLPSGGDHTWKRAQCEPPADSSSAPGETGASAVKREHGQADYHALWLHTASSSGISSSRLLASSLSLGRLTRVRLVSLATGGLEATCCSSSPSSCIHSRFSSPQPAPLLVYAVCLGVTAAHLLGWKCWSSWPWAVAVA